MNKIIFTLCSNNYLAQASLLVTSFLQHNADYTFYIGLVDAVNTSVLYPTHPAVKVLPCEEVLTKDLLKGMAQRYKIVELNTSLKPFYIEYFFRLYENCTVIYLDPDIYVYHSFDDIEEMLRSNEIILTPHCLTPIPLDEREPQERSFMKYGTYNLGFVALRKSANSVRFVKWLQERLAILCYSEVGIGVYVDQSWINLVPIFFENVYVSRHPGMNAAFWNLHERNFEMDKDRITVNKEYPLLFFHFSSFNTNSWMQLANNQNRFTVADRPDIETLFRDYAVSFTTAKQQYKSDIECIFMKRTFKQKLLYYWNRYQIRKELAI
ncbi:MAG: glycosyl transferase [Chitinophagaceae bacterium]|nr:glycosyl transferase [Chitinophagaceae bacterium]